MSDTVVKLVAGRPQRGTFPVSLMRGDEVLITGRVNPHKAQDTETFIKDACGQYPALPVDDLRAELRQLAAPRLATPAAQAGSSDDVPYLATPSGMMWRKPTHEGEILTPLTSFTAKIVANVERDDGAEKETAFEIEAAQGTRVVRFTIPAARFGAMNWPTEHLGAEAIVYPGTTVKDHVRVAIQMLSPKPIPRRTIYTHTGWRKIGDDWAYLHAGGAIGASGKVEGVQVELPAALGAYKLPDPPQGEALKAAICATLARLDLAPDLISVPGFVEAFRAAMGSCDFGIHRAGATGVFKTEHAALSQQHFGAGLGAARAPISGRWHHRGVGRRSRPVWTGASHGTATDDGQGTVHFGNAGPGASDPRTGGRRRE